MPEFEVIEREYRELSARIVYAIFEGEEPSAEDCRRLDELADLRVRLSAPDFRHLADEAA